MQSTLAAGAAAAVPSLAQAAADAPASGAATSQPKNEKPGLAVIGCGGISRYHAQYLPKHFNILAIADVDRGHAESYNKDIAGGKAFTTEDYREALARPGVEMVLIAVPDHWHSRIAIDAMRAGKDVYCEKPLTLTIDEQRVVCQVARETARIMQVGTQQRSDDFFPTAVALIHNGRVGKVKTVTVVIGPTPTPEGEEFKPSTPPAELNWDMWQGQAPATDYIDKRCHFTFRWWYEYAGGMMTDWGAHHVDIAQWAAAPDLPGPITVEPISVHFPVPFDAHGNPTVHNKYNTARAFNVKVTFANGVEMFLVDKSPKAPEENGILFEGDKGTLYVNRGKITGSAPDSMKDNPLPKGVVPPVAPVPLAHERHVINFLECTRTRAMPKSDVWSHCRNLTTCHLANIALRLNRKLRWDASALEITGDAEANAMLKRPQRKGYEVA
jgi:predicted dehydrogenase